MGQSKELIIAQLVQDAGEQVRAEWQEGVGAIADGLADLSASILTLAWATSPVRVTQEDVLETFTACREVVAPAAEADTEAEE